MKFLYNILLRNIVYIVFIGFYALYITWAKMQTPINPMIEFIVQGDGILNYIGQIYCRNQKHSYRQSNSAYFHYSEKLLIAPNTYKVRVEIPCKKDVTRLRFDPMISEGSLYIKSFRVHSNIWQEVDLQQLTDTIKPLSNIEKITYSKQGINIISNGLDPYVELTDDLQSYLIPKSKHYHKLFFKYFINTYFSVMLLLFLVNKILNKGPKIVNTYNSIKSSVDNNILKGINFVSALFKRPVTINFLIITICFILFTIANLIFYNHLFAVSSFQSLLVLFAFTLLYCTLILVYTFFLGLANRRLYFRILFGFFLLLTGVVFLADMALFTLNGMHVNHGITMLFSGGITNFIKNLAFTKLSWFEINIYLGLIVLGIIFCWAAVWFIEKRLKRFNFKTSFAKMVLVSLLCYFTFYLIQKTSFSQLLPNKLDSIETNHAFYFSLVQHNNYILSYAVKTKPFKNKKIPNGLIAATGQDLPSKVFIFIFESLREDMVNDEVMPNLNEFKSQSWHFARAISSGNATHYGWYSIVNSKNPYYWERYNNLKDKQGSKFLKAFKDLGYKINVYTAKDLSYLNSDKVMFGEKLDLPTYISDHPKLTPQEHDKRVINKLINDLHVKSNNQSLNLIFLDSSHYPYRWISSDIDEIKPYVGTPNKGVNLTKAKQLIKEKKALIFNRYKNANKFSDKLFGQVVHTINSSQYSENSIIIAVGDHGQQFLEHNYLLHGYTLFSEDIHIPFYIKGPKTKTGLDPQTATQVDIFPTLVDMLNINLPNNISDGVSLLKGKQKYGLSAAAGMQNTPYGFVVENSRYKLFFHIEKNNPINSSKLYVDSIFTFDDKVYQLKNSTKEAYQEFIKKEFPGFPYSLNFIE